MICLLNHLWGSANTNTSRTGLWLDCCQATHKHFPAPSREALCGSLCDAGRAERLRSPRVRRVLTSLNYPGLCSGSSLLSIHNLTQMLFVEICSSMQYECLLPSKASITLQANVSQILTAGDQHWITWNRICSTLVGPLSYMWSRFRLRSDSLLCDLSGEHTEVVSELKRLGHRSRSGITNLFEPERFLKGTE